MEKLRPQEVDIPTYDFEVQKTIGILSTRVMFRVNHIEIHGVIPIHNCAP